MDIRKCTNFVNRTELISNYLSDINAFDVMTAKEERDLFSKYEVATEEEKLKIRSEIISRNQRFVYAVAKHYATGDTLPDLISEGNLGFMEAFDTYDWKTGNRFSSYAVWYIRRAINAYLTKENLLVRSTNAIRVVPKVKKIENEFYVKYGKKPSSTEVLEIMAEKYPDLKIKNESDLYGIQMEYIDAAMSADDDDNVFGKSSEFNEATASLNDVEDVIDEEALSASTMAALRTLDERELKIVKMHTGIGYSKEYNNNEIAEHVGLTSERVRQIYHAAVAKMKQVYTR